MWVLCDPPVPFEALGRNARAKCAAVEQPLGEPRIVAIQEGARVGAEGVDLQKTRLGSFVCSLL